MKTFIVATIVGCVGCVFLLVAQRCAKASYCEDIYVIDLTHELSNSTPFWPGNPPLVFTILNRGKVPAGFWYEANKFETSEHGGTHLDAPAHFAKGQWRVHEIPVERLVGSGVVINVTDSAAANPDYRLNVSDLIAWESKHGVIPRGAIVFMLSGWSARYPNKTLTFNTKNVSDPSSFHFPGFHPAAADWLIQNRNISMIGVDTPSVDYAQSTAFDVHQKVARANIMGLENVNNLEKVPPSGSTIFVGAVKLFDGSGGPVRILAIVDNKVVPSWSCPSAVSSDASVVRSYSGLATVLLFVLFCHQIGAVIHL